MIHSRWSSTTVRRKAVWGSKRTIAAALLVILGLAATALAKPKYTQKSTARKAASRHVDEGSTLDAVLTLFAEGGRGRHVLTVDVIVTLDKGHRLPQQYRRYVRGGRLDIINGYALQNLPVTSLQQLSKFVGLHRAHYNRPARGQDFLSSVAVHADGLAQQYGLTGEGVTVAFIDSGISSYPLEDLADNRVVKFVDFVNRGNTLRSDLNGHGTHVTGIVAGTGQTESKYAGIAPGTNVVSLRVLDENGQGSIGDTIAAMDWVSKNAQLYNIKVVNMSVGAGVYESYLTDPLTLAARALVDQGITVVAAAGNFGKNAKGELQWGGVTAPGVAPWVLTVCAFSTKGTLDLGDDALADFSSSGPSAVDFGAKPDICAPGVGIVSLSAPESQLYSLGATATPSWLLGDGTLGYSPYISLTGTSQAVPFVSGTIALMLQANPNLTPNLIKAILEYTASFKPDVSPLRQGAGFMNAKGAVELAQFYTNPGPDASLALDPSWSQHFIWGNHLLSGGVITPTANAWTPGVQWGSATTQATDGDNIVWGTLCDDCDNIVWGTILDGDNIVWGTFGDVGDNIVWGTVLHGDNIVWGGSRFDDDNIVWGTVCGGDNCDNVIWGSFDPVENIVWGTLDLDDNIVWGTLLGEDNIVWGTYDLDNIVWGTFWDDLDNIVWGTDGRENVVWRDYRKTTK